MFIGHFAVGLAAKKVSPATPLPLLFVAAQFVDLLWPILVLVGIERVEIAPGITVMTPLEFTSYPISHSFVTSVGWGLLLGGGAYALRKNLNEFWVLAGCVVSHWVLDVVSHRPDMPLAPGMDVKIGLGLWNSFAGTVIVELGLFAVGTALYLSATCPKVGRSNLAFWGLAGTLLVIALLNIVGPPPPSVAALAWSANAMWLFILWAWWVDRRRVPQP